MIKIKLNEITLTGMSPKCGVSISNDEKKTLVTAVSKFPTLWNLSEKSYHDIIGKSICWNKVAEECGQDIEWCKTQWKYLKEKFRRERSKMECHYKFSSKPYKRWSLFDQMMFVNDFIKPMKVIPNPRQIELLQSARSPLPKSTESLFNNGSGNESYLLENSASSSMRMRCDTPPEPLLFVEASPSRCSSVSEVHISEQSSFDPFDREDNAAKLAVQNIRINSRKRKRVDPTQEMLQAALKTLNRSEEQERNSTALFFRSMAEEASNLPLKERLELQSEILSLVINKVSNMSQTS